MNLVTSQQIAARRYRIERYLTEGGMGAIYVGKKLGPGGFAKDVVLKQLLPEYTSRPEFRDLFFREARISATLDHANIVHTFDLVQSDESLFIVMEYVRGADLRTIVRRARLRRQELAPAAAIHIILEILDGLAYAHTRRDGSGTSLEIIHRDVSPSNILCSSQGEVKLSDFGIAKASTHSSVFYRVRGKVGYMSPEQARNEPIDHRSDLYSLGVCLHEALTAERLFVGDLSTPPEEIYRQPIAPVSHKRLGIPPALDGVLAKALAPAIDARYQNATEFGEALREVAHRNGMAFSTPELAAHLQQILGDDPERWLRDDPAPAPPNTQKIHPSNVSQGVGHEGKEAASLGLVDEIAEDDAIRNVLSPMGSRSVSESKDFDLDSLLEDRTVRRSQSVPTAAAAPPAAAPGAPPPPAAVRGATRPGGGPAAPRAAAGAGQSASQGSNNNNNNDGGKPDDPASPGTPPPVWTRANAPIPSPVSQRPTPRYPLPGATPPARPPAPRPPPGPAPRRPTPPPPPSIADPPTPLPPIDVSLETPPPTVRPGAPPPPPVSEFEDATPAPPVVAAPPAPRPTSGRVWQPAPGLPPPPTGHRPAPPVPPFAQRSTGPVPVLRPPETFTFTQSGPMTVKGGGVPLGVSLFLLLAAFVGGAFLARRVTRDETAMLLAGAPAVPGATSAPSAEPKAAPATGEAPPAEAPPAEPAPPVKGAAPPAAGDPGAQAPSKTEDGAKAKADDTKPQATEATSKPAAPSPHQPASQQRGPRRGKHVAPGGAKRKAGGAHGR